MTRGSRGKIREFGLFRLILVVLEVQITRGPAGYFHTCQTMLFNSLEFAVFLPIVFLVYWLLRNRGPQNAFLVIASYVFYGWWDWRFLFLIFCQFAGGLPSWLFSRQGKG